MIHDEPVEYKDPTVKTTDPMLKALDIIRNLELQLAVACDLLNTWAREAGVEECHDPYQHLKLRALADRLWAKASITESELRQRVYRLEGGS